MNKPRRSCSVAQLIPRDSPEKRTRSGRSSRSSRGLAATYRGAGAQQEADTEDQTLQALKALTQRHHISQMQYLSFIILLFLRLLFASRGSLFLWAE
ncbi:Histone-lysine N-methyltransferase EZH1 [Fusarium oxysporum f. sp. albedinis]|nr:Histone-lysine N-methyltransferase EZH1 [Fusarium oxysporum f. sp. albedinis]